MHKDAMPRVFASDNLSLAWGQVMLALAARGVDEISPLVVSISGFAADGVAAKSPSIRTALDALLKRHNKNDTENVAMTIFPERYLKMADGNADEFFELYRESFPRIQDFAPGHNRRGSYFQRLVDYEGDGEGFNQLEWILNEYSERPTTRRSKWQATTFDPRRDLSAAGQLEFPCLQQVSFTFSGRDGLALNAFYATQQILRKGYGNYLGLARLGAFMASRMQRRLVRLNIFVGVAQIDNKLGKGAPDVRALLQVVESELTSAEAA